MTIHNSKVSYDTRMDRRRIGTLVRGRRDVLDLTLREAAEQGGMSHSTWGHIETGIVNTTVDMLAEVARVLNSRWEIRLVATAERAPARQELIDRIDALADVLPEREVRLLLAQLTIYEEELGIHGQSSK